MSANLACRFLDVVDATQLLDSEGCQTERGSERERERETERQQFRMVALACPYPNLNAEFTST